MSEATPRLVRPWAVLRIQLWWAFHGVFDMLPLTYVTEDETLFGIPWLVWRRRYNYIGHIGLPKNAFDDMNAISWLRAELRDQTYYQAPDLTYSQVYELKKKARAMQVHFQRLR